MVVGKLIFSILESGRNRANVGSPATRPQRRVLLRWDSMYPMKGSDLNGERIHCARGLCIANNKSPRGSSGMRQSRPHLLVLG